MLYKGTRTNCKTDMASASFVTKRCCKFSTNTLPSGLSRKRKFGGNRTADTTGDALEHKDTDNFGIGELAAEIENVGN